MFNEAYMQLARDHFANTPIPAPEDLMRVAGHRNSNPVQRLRCVVHHFMPKFVLKSAKPTATGQTLSVKFKGAGDVEFAVSIHMGGYLRSGFPKEFRTTVMALVWMSCKRRIYQLAKNAPIDPMIFREDDFNAWSSNDIMGTIWGQIPNPGASYPAWTPDYVIQAFFEEAGFIKEVDKAIDKIMTSGVSSSAKNFKKHAVKTANRKIRPEITTLLENGYSEEDILDIVRVLIVESIQKD